MSVIGLSAEVRVCTVLTRETGGTYHVCLDESHFKELLLFHVKPPPANAQAECSLIRMGGWLVCASRITLAHKGKMIAKLSSLIIGRAVASQHRTCNKNFPFPFVYLAEPLSQKIFQPKHMIQNYKKRHRCTTWFNEVQETLSNYWNTFCKKSLQNL